MNNKKKKNFVCPICKGQLAINRIDDAEMLCSISEDGKDFNEIGSRSDGSTTIYCMVDESHKIPNDLQEKIMDLFYEWYI